MTSTTEQEEPVPSDLEPVSSDFGPVSAGLMPGLQEAEERVGSPYTVPPEAFVVGTDGDQMENVRAGPYCSQVLKILGCSFLRRSPGVVVIHESLT